MNDANPEPILPKDPWVLAISFHTGESAHLITDEYAAKTAYDTWVDFSRELVDASFNVENHECSISIDGFSDDYDRKPYKLAFLCSSVKSITVHMA